MHLKGRLQNGPICLSLKMYIASGEFDLKYKEVL